jgi:hypothetical protein
MRLTRNCLNSRDLLSSNTSCMCCMLYYVVCVCRVGSHSLIHNRIENDMSKHDIVE